jgi:diguanylate cyclase (GGDEF)-like protein
MRITGGRRSRTPLVVRLICVLLVPMIAVGVQLVVSAVQRSQVARRSADIDVACDDLIQTVALGSAIIKERLPTDVALGPAAQGTSGADVAGRLGFDLFQEQATRRTATDAAARRLAGAPWVAGAMREVGKARAAMDSGTSDQSVRDAGAASIRQAQKLVENQVLTQIARITRTAAVLSDSAELATDLAAMQTAYQLSVTFIDESNAVGALVGLIKDARLSLTVFSSQVTDPVIAIALASALYVGLEQQLLRQATPAVSSRYRQVKNAPAAQQIAGYFDTVIKMSSSPAGARLLHSLIAQQGVAQSAVLVRSAFGQLDALDSVVAAAGNQVASEARAQRRAADRDYRISLLLAGLAGVAALVGIVAVSRGVTRPLRQVAARAREISAGELRGSPAPSGPREVAAVSQAFDEVVENLRLLQDQAAALATGDTDNPVLATRVPGPLGQNMQASVERLARSLQTRERLEARLRHEATHDGLTGLLNRSAAIVALEQGLARIRRSGQGLGAVQVSLDRLRAVNDTAGHLAGDAVIRQAGQTIAAAVRGEDAVARLGSDEFVVVTEVESVELLLDQCARITDALRHIDRVEVTGAQDDVRVVSLPDGISASIGIAVTLDGVPDATELLRDASNAVGKAKAAGGGRTELLDVALSRELGARARITDALRRALDDGGLRLEYQPITDLSGRTVGVEALCRWNDAELGIVRPDVFIRAAEASDLILDVDRWVLTEALGQLRRWDTAGQMTGVYVSVNVSGRHLRGGTLVHDVSTALTGAGIPPDRLLVEITETVLLSDLDTVATQLRQLRETGVRIAIDDFGTGYTSIAHLQRLPVDVLKIDRSFISAMREARGESLVRLMMDMADVLGVRVVAEGVETDDELARLRTMGSPLVQGFLTGRPADARALAEAFSSANSDVPEPA